jgi:DNA-binding NtrC family response regulator
VSLRGSVLLVDDEERLRRHLGRALREEGHEVVTAADAAEAERLLAERAFDVLVIDNLMPGRTGLELIADVVAGGTESPEVVMMTAHASVESAISAMKLGAFDYLQKPFEVEELAVAVGRAVEHHRLRGQQRYLLAERDEEFGHYGIIGRSRGMQELLDVVGRVGPSRSTVLITGETGTGKELVARALHDRAAKGEVPLIKVNCAAIPEGLLESELFGHVRGAFTGAVATKRGKFALADGGSLFLDEVAFLPLALQPKLLRVLQERELEPLGSERTQKVDVRVIAATSRDLRQMVADGRFLQDLFYRLSVIPIAIPPLRDRRDDIPLLVEHFVRKHASRAGRAVQGVDDAALEALRRYDWPGNVRELENTIERAVVLCRAARIQVEDVSMLGAAPARSAPGLPSARLRENVEWAEKESVRRALEEAGGVKKDAAQRLGLSQRALSYYLSKYGFERDT